MTPLEKFKFYLDKPEIHFLTLLKLAEAAKDEDPVFVSEALKKFKMSKGEK